MYSEGRVIGVVLGRRCLTMTDGQKQKHTKIKLGLKTGAGSSQGKSVQAPIRFVILHSVYDSLGRLTTASERNG